MTKKELFFKLKEQLDLLYENPHCTLDYTTPFELLVATILSAQCTDARVNIVTKTIFPKYNTPEAFASLSEVEIAKMIQSTGFYKKHQKLCHCTGTKPSFPSSRHDGGTDQAGRSRQKNRQRDSG